MGGDKPDGCQAGATEPVTGLRAAGPDRASDTGAEPATLVISRLMAALEDSRRREAAAEARARQLEAALAQAQHADGKSAETVLADPDGSLKSEYLASMSHDLRTPLNTINGFADLMQQGIYGPVTPKQKERLQSIMTRSRELLGLINEVVELARIETGRLDLSPQAFDARELLLDCLLPDDGTPQEAARDALTASLETPVEVWHDKDRLRQLLTRLARLTRSAPPWPVVSLKQDAGYLHISLVTQQPFDPGAAPGQEGEHARRQLRKRYHLVICRRLVELMGGRLQESFAPALSLEVRLPLKQP